MSSPDYTIKPEQVDHQNLIESLLDDAFGLSRRTKTSYRLREGEQPVDGLSFVAETAQDKILGAISFWRLHIGCCGDSALLLGPLAVDPAFQGRGVGRALMRHGLHEAQTKGHRLVILVGDEPYYARVGFQRVPEGRLLMPGPVDPTRLLFLELQPEALSPVSGLVLPPHRFSRIQARNKRLRIA